jgi:hypothetical protein
MRQESLRFFPSDEQPGSYQLAGPVSTDKRACIKWSGKLPGDLPLGSGSYPSAARGRKDEPVACDAHERFCITQTPTQKKGYAVRCIKVLSVQWPQRIENSRLDLPEIGRIKAFHLDQKIEVPSPKLDPSLAIRQTAASRGVACLNSLEIDSTGRRRALIPLSGEQVITRVSIQPWR